MPMEDTQIAAPAACADIHLNLELHNPPLQCADSCPDTCNR